MGLFGVFYLFYLNVGDWLILLHQLFYNVLDHLCSDHLYDFGDCYDNNVVFQRELLKLKLENIPDNMKIKDIKDDFYWINIKVLKSLIDLFVVLISPPYSTIGFTDRTPIHLLPQQYLPLKWTF